MEMDMHKLTSLIVLGLVAALASCHPGGKPPTSPPGDTSNDAFVELARGPLHLDVPAGVEVKTEKNFTGFRSGDVLFSRRSDSRTYFVQDRRYGAMQPGGTFAGSDAELIDRAREMLSALGLPASEVERASVLEEKTRVGHRDPVSNQMVLEPTQPGNRSVLVTRRIAGVPVFSSRALMEITKTGSAGFVELHWPDIPAGAVEEAHRLQTKVKSDWRPPGLEGARVESVEAGIIHSPAIGFVMDVYPAIRVVYASANGKLGRKPVAYLDAAGKPVPVPRQFEQELPAPKETARPRPR